MKLSILAARVDLLGQTSEKITVKLLAAEFPA
jgi:hypothetical protein